MDGTSVWIDRFLTALDQCDPRGHFARQYLVDHRIRVGVHNQPTAARWTVLGNIQLHPRYLDGEPDAAYPLSLIVHEVQHLRQGFLVALSVFGELEAWQIQFSLLKTLTGQYHSLTFYNAIIKDLQELPLILDREILTQARALMQDYAGQGYRVDLLPLYPIQKEVAFRIAAGLSIMPRKS